MGNQTVKFRHEVIDADPPGSHHAVTLVAGRLAWCAPPDWEPHILRDDLFHPHSLGIADFNGDGLPDIFVGEMGLGKNPDPRMILYLNRAAAELDEVIFERGIPTHEAKVADLTGDGRPDIVGKPYVPERHIDVWFNEA